MGDDERVALMTQAMMVATQEAYLQRAHGHRNWDAKWYRDALQIAQIAIKTASIRCLYAQVGGTGGMWIPARILSKN